MTTYNALTPQQREQVTELFCDPFFGTDPTQYVYELTGDVVAGRKALTASQTTSRKPRRVNVRMNVREALCVSDEQVRKMESVYQAIARRICARMIATPVEA